jgi:PAS domain S-box-containing protein
MQTALEWALDAASACVLLVDEAGRVVHANARSESLFGYARDALIGQPLGLLLTEPCRADVERRCAALLRGAPDLVTTLLARRKDGGELNATLRLQLVATDERRLIGAIIEVADPADATQHFGDHFRIALEAAPTGMLLVNDAGRILLVNAQIERVFGYSREELVGQSLELLVPARLRGDHEGHRRSFFAHASTRPMGAGRDLYGLHKSGLEVPVEIALTPLKQREGRLVLTSIIDITERKLVESALRENEARYRELFSNSPVALLEQDFSEARRYLLSVRNGDGGDFGAWLAQHPDVLREAISRVVTVMANDRAIELLEAGSADALVSLSFFAPETIGWFRAAVCQLFRGERYFGQETLTRTLRGGLRVVSKRLHVVPGHDDVWSRVVVSLFDLTLHKEAEQQLRTSLREKEMLLREIHHRVKNNLQIISSLLNMKADSLEGDTTSRQVFNDCQARIQSLAFVHEHLYVSADLSHVPFGDYARTLVEHLKRSCRKPGLAVTTNVDIDAIELSIDDAIPCGLIVNELVTNALKHAFSIPGSGTIQISMHELDGAEVELAVQDDGHGLPPGLNPRDSGTLGLDLVFTFAEQLRATVQVSPEPGTSFAIRFKPGSTARAAH